MKMQQLNENFIFEQGTDPDTLLILFTGFANKLQIQPFEFMQVSGLYNYSRILVRDPTQRMYLCGIGGELNTFHKFVENLRETAQALKARKIITIGSSGGAHAALLTAHLLEAEYSHVFAPFPYLSLKTSIQQRNWSGLFHFRRTIFKLNFLPTGVRRYYDLHNVLDEWNGHSRYFVHVCQQHRRDYKMAKYLEGLPGIKILPYPCDQHAVIRYLARQKMLDKVFDLGEQDKMEDLAASISGKKTTGVP